MNTIDLMFADNNEVIVDALVSKIREQGEVLEDLQNSVDKLMRTVQEVQGINEKLKADLAAAKKTSKTPNAPDLPIVKSIKMVRGLPKKATAVPVKRGRGRPKKAVE
jgi:predicted RNase H-like nuclease (RuvC/YqgF family)